MIFKKFRSSDDGVVGIVVTVLLIGLIIAVTVMLNTVYVPQWLESSEASHMEEVSNQFTQLKYALDIQSIANDSTAISTSITMGTKEIPFFNQGRTFDFLEITEDEFNISIDRNASSTTYSYSSDSIKYSSGNSFFVDQSFIFQGGALILHQDESSVLYGKPSFFVTEYGRNLTFSIVKINAVSSKSFASGYGIYPIYTESINPSFQYTEINNVTNINFTTDYPNAWRIALNNTLRYSGMDHNLNVSNDGLNVEFEDDTGRFYTLFIREVEISTQIGFGIAE